MRRRDFIALLGGAAAPWPLIARAQQPDQLRRIGVLMPPAASDIVAGTYLSRFAQALHEVGWTAGSTVQMDVRWASGELDRMPTLAKELVALQPNVILYRRLLHRHIKTDEMRHLIAPSSMPEAKPTSIQSSSQKGMHAHYLR